MPHHWASRDPPIDPHHFADAGDQKVLVIQDADEAELAPLGKASQRPWQSLVAITRKGDSAMKALIGSLKTSLTLFLIRSRGAPKARVNQLSKATSQSSI
jgi:hypothetical protein